MREKIVEEIEIPEKVEVKVEDFIKVKGPLGENKKFLKNPQTKIEVKDKKIIISAEKGTRREKKMIKTFKAHLINMIKGIIEGHEYTLKICSGHFPMNVAVQDNKFIIKNFLGENEPRTFKLKDNVEVKIEGEEVKVKSIDKEAAGQTAANIEQLTKIKGRDRRIFQDGIYITNKDGKEIK